MHAAEEVGVQGQGASLGGLVTPVPVTSLGLPSPAACTWGIDISAGSYPMTYTQGTSSASLRMSNVPIPNTPAGAGVTFYTQNLALDLGSGSPSLFPSTAMRWLIGTGIRLPASRVHRVDTTLPTTGSVAESNAAVVAFVY